jgi:hypothetical protein
VKYAEVLLATKVASMLHLVNLALSHAYLACDSRVMTDWWQVLKFAYKIPR